jgi:hypothetical protein
MALNHIQITNAKSRDKAYKLADSDGLYLFIQPNGAKLWRMNYRHLGRQKTLYFGAWPEVGIAAARQQRDKAREQIAAGLDPAAEKRIETLARKVAADNTFKTIAEEWVAKNEREGRAPITLDKIRWLLGMAYPMIGTLPISKITPQEVLAVLRKVEATGRYESARRMRSVLSRVFRYSQEEMTAHGFRAMAATLLNEMGIGNPDAIEKQLAHLDTSMVRRAYTRGEYWDERVKMMQHWSHYLEQLRDGAKILRPHFGVRR